MTTPSRNPVPSELPQDLKFNSGKIDEFVNSIINQYIDRFGSAHLTIAGITALARSVIEQIKADGAEAVASIGWQELGDWAVSLTINNREQIVWYDNAWYKYIGELPHTIIGDSPATDGGIWSDENPSGKWVNIGDASLRSSLASTIDGAGDSMVAVKQPFAGAVARTQHDKNAEIASIQDFGYAKDTFDTDGIDAANKSALISSKIPYIGSKQFSLTQQSLKAWTYLDGYKERGAVVSFMNTSSPNAPEPVTQVLGISSAAGLGQYSDRDFVGVFTQIEGPPSLLTTSATTFTTTTVTSSAISSVASYLRAGQIIDVKDAVDTSKTYSGLIKSLSGTTVTVDTAWYLKGGGGTVTGIPATGSTAAFVPNTKLWAHNANVVLNPNSQATSIVGFELGLINKKIDGYIGYGYDCVNLGPYGIGNAFQARNKFNIGFNSGPGKNFGFTSQAAATNGYYSLSDNVGFQSQNSVAYGVQIKNPGEYALIVQSSDNSFRTGIDASGRWQGLKLYSQIVKIGGTITQYAAVAFATPTANGDTINLPLPANANSRTLYIRNLSSSNSLFVAGSYEGGLGGISLAAKNTIQLFSDGTYWYPLSKYSA
ncbi:hypothetical protein [Serratia fonticola]|uniref:hypothetical protein n=1 Tax=Serratia fonticola TaxID=47917 RepID=UPI003AAB3EF3